MKRIILYICVLLTTVVTNGYCEDTSETPKHYGGQGGGRPSDEQIAAWRAKRAAQSARPAVPIVASPVAAGSESRRRGGAPDIGTDGLPRASGRPSDGSSGGSRPGGGVPGSGRGAGILWLSDTPPSRGDGARTGSVRPGGMGGMGGMEMGGGERGAVPKKRLWLRTGNDPQRSGFAQSDADATVEIVLVTPKSKPEGEALPPAKEERAGLSFEMPTQGFYRLYLTQRKLHGDTLNVAVAKAEVANFTHGGDEEESKKTITALRYSEMAQLEIVRERKVDEKKFFQLTSGEDQAFILLRKGLPFQGARVRFVSHQGWTKEAVSDEQGRVSFQIIRDYFPPWEKFQKRFKASYLVMAEYSAPEVGIHKDQPYTQVRYQASLAGSYYPSPNDYRSYSWGLGIGLFITLFCGVAVYLYRRRRLKPFQEARFSEK